MKTPTYAPATAAQGQTETIEAKPAPGADPTAAAKEQVAGGPLMLIAYAMIWIFLFGYLFRLKRAQNQLASEVDALEQRLDHQIGQMEAQADENPASG